MEPHGDGEYSMADDRKYEEKQYKDGKKHGKGVYTITDGRQWRVVEWARTKTRENRSTSHEVNLNIIHKLFIYRKDTYAFAYMFFNKLIVNNYVYKNNSNIIKFFRFFGNHNNSFYIFIIIN